MNDIINKKLMAAALSEIVSAGNKRQTVHFGYMEAVWFTVDGHIAYRLPMSQDLLQGFSSDVLSKHKSKMFEHIGDTLNMIESWDRMDLLINVERRTTGTGKKAVEHTFSILQCPEYRTCCDERYLKRMLRAGAEYFYQKTAYEPIYCMDQSDECIGIILPCIVNGINERKKINE